jgi:8-oxo-dGTP pyrophosphatase MutT (NUDIX family)
MNPSEPPLVEVYVDPVCPFAWITSRWLIEVARLDRIQLRIRVMSLSVLNEGRDDISEFYRDLVDRAWGTARVLIATEHHHGEAAVARLYQAFGARLHLGDRRADQALILEALNEAGLPSALADAAESLDLDEPLRASHHRGMSPVGEDVGTPVVHVHATTLASPVAFFGPVLSSCPTGQAALQLWDGVLALASTPEFFELKRSRNVALSFN